MNNVLLDPLPTQWISGKGDIYELDADFQIGIQICLLYDDPEWSDFEKIRKVTELLFVDDVPEYQDDIEECINWFLNGWNHDKHKKSKKSIRVIDFDVDQWRIYSAFRKQYNINLNEADLHWWEFMGLLSTLEECAYTRVLDIRQKKITSKMSKEEKESLTEAKEIYALESIKSQKDIQRETELEERDKAAIEEFNRLRKRNRVGG